MVGWVNVFALWRTFPKLKPRARAPFPRQDQSTSPRAQGQPIFLTHQIQQLFCDYRQPRNPKSAEYDI